MDLSRLYQKFLLWRVRNLSNRNFILIISFLVGICGGLAAVVMKGAVHYIQNLLTMGVPAKYHNYLFFIYPIIGILLVVLFRILFRFKSFAHGISHLLFIISKRSSVVEPEKMYTPIVSASLTVGFGGSVGLESPIVTTGAAIGSSLGRLFQMGYKKRTLLLGCGVAAGIGGIFNAPFTGLLFCIEVLLLELSVPAFIPLLIASVTGTIVANLLHGEETLLNFTLTQDFYTREIPFYILLGSITGGLAVFFVRTFNRVTEHFNKIKDSFLRVIYGGLALGLLIFIFPPLYGEGYNHIKQLLAGDTSTLLSQSYFFNDLTQEWFLLLFVGLIILIKVFASAFTIGAGGNGGSFAPSLFVGALTGFFVSHLVNTLNILPFHLSEPSFILVGMAGMMSGVLHAPLTAIFLIAEITGGYTLILPLMIVSAIAFVSSSYIEPHSVYIKQLSNIGHIHYLDKDRTVLTKLQLKKVLEKDLVPVRSDVKLRDLIDIVSRSKRNLFPVLDKELKLVGIILLDDIRHLMFKPELYDTVAISDLMHPPPAFIKHTDSMEEVMQKFDSTGAWNLPVVDGNGTYVGVISKSKIFSHYRSLLKKQAKEDTEIIE